MFNQRERRSEGGRITTASDTANLELSVTDTAENKRRIDEWMSGGLD
jgi:hypothetical protein